YGTEDDLKRFLHEAHSTDMKVIMHLVINHTSINHPWYQAAKSEENSQYRDYYWWVYKTDKKDCNHLLEKS
ncbi:alpha-amylase family glycosyl hydrolase, partial [Coprococcus eutactus]|uniref:alpha-amylase family glycosyl hydrolase n=1 Tax=Coprococcus eutactus TaxID=33043 RepID=UPI00210C0907